MQGVKINLTDEQIAWFIENFPKVTNAEICEHFGCKESFVHRLARKYGLTKGDEFKKWREEKARNAVKAYYRVHTQRGNPEPIAPYRFTKGFKCKEWLGEEKFMAAIWKGVAHRKETVRVERARIAFGLEQRTKMRLKKQPHAKVCARHYLKKKGYILDEENLIAYYTDSTDRAWKMEAAPRRYYTFKPYAAS